MELIKKYINENGKEYGVYKDVCPRCGGVGISDNIGWKHYNNGKCYKCEGKGYIIEEKRILTEKEKAQRERAKELKEFKTQKEFEDRQSNEQNKLNEFITSNPKLYICIDKDSYSKKELLKANGYKYQYGLWYGYTQIKNVELLELNSINYLEIAFNKIEIKSDLVHEAINNYKESINNTEYIGLEGDKIQLDVNLESYKIYDGYVYGTSTYYYNFTTVEGNKLQWKTSKDLEIEEGTELTIKGTIKELKEDDDCNKITVLTRCKIIK